MCAFALAWFACASTPPKPAAPSVKSFWRLKRGDKMVFKAVAGGRTTYRTIQVKRFKDGWYGVGRGQRLRHDADGLFDGQRYLMRRPLRVGAEWQSIPRPGVIERFKVVRVNTRCRPRTRFAKRCVVVEARQNIGAEVLLTRWWYGRRAGLLRVEVFVQSASGALTRQSLLQRVEKAP